MHRILSSSSPLLLVMMIALILLFISTNTAPTEAGVGYFVCLGLCYAAGGALQYASHLPGAVMPYFTTSCPVFCTMYIAVACFDPVTMLTVLNNNNSTNMTFLSSVAIAQVQPGMTVLGADGLPTTVIRVQRSFGNFSSVRLTAADNELTLHVTEDHVLIVACRSEEEIAATNNTISRHQQHCVTAARNVRSGDRLLRSSGSLVRIKSVERTMLHEKVAIFTSSGHVTVNNGLTATTGCGDVIQRDKEPLEEYLSLWKRVHLD